MTLETLVPSRETCERMKVAGWTRPTVFAWAHNWPGSGEEWVLIYATDPARPVEVPAPTAQEIADELVGRVGPGWELPYWPEPHGHGGWFWMNQDGEIVRASTMVEALAALWIALNEKEKP